MATEFCPAWKRRRVENMVASNNSDLVAAEETVKRCRERQYELRSLLNNTVSIMSSLPSEVISEIFLAASYEESMHPRSRRLPTQFLIGRVCKAWREIAWNTPQLWYKAVICLRKERYEAQKCLLEEWIQRGANCPLKLGISTFQQWEPPADAFAVIIKSCHRWTTFISCTFTSLSLALDSGNSLEFPLLKKLVLRRNDPSITPPQKWVFNFPPILKNLAIQGNLSDRGLTVNWTILTKLTVDIILGPRRDGTYIPLKILGTCKSLEYLDCRLHSTITHNQGHFPSHTAISFPFLEGLHLRATPSTSVQFMKMTRVPSLKRFTINTSTARPTPESSAWTTALLDWAKCSSFKLESLNIAFDNLGDELCIVELLRQLSPGHPINGLTITANDDRFHFSDTLVELLAMPPLPEKQENYLPKLTSFIYHGNISFSIHEMIYMLQSRSPDEKLEERSSEDEDTEHENDDKDNNNNESIPNKKMGNKIANGSSRDPPDEVYFEIEYRNREWFQKQSPNRMPAFYRAMEEFEKQGGSINFSWDGYVTDDECYC